MNELYRDFIEHMTLEAAKQADWIEFEEAGGGARLVGGPVACHVDRVSFEDDSGLMTEIPYGAITAIRTGRQGEGGAGLRRSVPAFATDLAA